MNENPINTRCPACHSVFNATNGQLKVADGLVRCGGCLHIFNAQQSADKPLSDKKDISSLPPSSSPAPTPAPTPTPTIAKKTTATAAPLSKTARQPTQQLTKKPTKPLTKQLTKPLTNQLSKQPQKRVIAVSPPPLDPDLYEETLTERSLSRHITHFLIIALTALCAAQILWFQKDRWIQDDQLRPIYQSLYTLIDHPLPAKRSPATKPSCGPGRSRPLRHSPRRRRPDG